MARGPLEFKKKYIVHKFYEILYFRFKKILLSTLNIILGPFKQKKKKISPNNNNAQYIYIYLGSHPKKTN